MDVLFSIIIASYNDEFYVSDCIQSLLNQSFGDFELIIIDDGSTDNTIDIIKKYQNLDARVRLVCLEKNHGAGYARNVGLRLARGQYLLFLDADDFFDIRMLEGVCQAFSRDQSDIVMYNFFICNEETHEETLFDEYNLFRIQSLKMPCGLEQISEYAFQIYHEIAWNKAFSRKLILDHCVFFQEQHNANDQFFVFANLLNATRISFIREAYAHYRLHYHGQLSKKIDENPFCIYEATKLCRNYLLRHKKRGLLKSFNTYVVNRLLFSIQNVNDENKEKLYTFYQQIGWKSLQMSDCLREDFRDALSYQLFLKMNECKRIETVLEMKSLFRWRPKMIVKLIDRIQKGAGKTVLWGAGRRGKEFLEIIEKNRFAKLDMVVDANPNMIGTELHSYVVSSIEKVEDGSYVFITNINHLESIRNMAKSLNIAVCLVDLDTYMKFDADPNDVMIRI
ncbi:MAG: glycosyltransferase [Lachnospiraceae bacterium]|nr:glycosyltransferase [Lachnospiraceae bacterium]